MKLILSAIFLIMNISLANCEEFILNTEDG